MPDPGGAVVAPEILDMTPVGDSGRYTTVDEHSYVFQGHAL